MSESAGSPLVRLRFSPVLRELLADVVGRVQAAHAAAPDSPALPAGRAGEPVDAELLAAWAEGLRERADEDMQALQALVVNPRFGQADLPLTSAAAEALLRASVRVRLHVRETLLRDLNSAAVEGGLDVYDLPPSEQQGYACYRALVYLESDLLAQLDPDLAQP